MLQHAEAEVQPAIMQDEHLHAFEKQRFEL
jgi:hypothetical protein